MRLAVAIAIAILVLLPQALGQTYDPAEPRASSAPQAKAAERSAAVLMAETGMAAEGYLSVEQLISFLRNNPEVADELQADLLAEEEGSSADAPSGVAPAPGSIEGQSLEARLRRDPALQLRVRDWLVERGYLTEPGRDGAARSGAADARPSVAAPLAATKEEDGIRRKRSPYPGLPSLTDLYGQVSPKEPELKRFGLDVFAAGRMRNGNLDLPAGPDYVLGPGDNLTIDVWGGVSRRMLRTVDREGRVVLPEAGTVVIAGLTLAQATAAIEKALQPQYRNAKVDVSLARVRSVRVYVVGEVVRPGAYDVSSLSTALNALYLAGGPTQRGSLRRLEQYRGKERVRSIDLYDLLLRGVRSDTERLQAGDTILVPAAGPQVAMSGMVRRPAIYELRDEADLSQAVDLAGGLLPSATLHKITVERVIAHTQRITTSIDLPDGTAGDAMRQALATFRVQDGDRVRVAPIRPQSMQTVYLEGHVVQPGKYAYRSGMQLSDLLRSYEDLLPEPAAHAEIVRLVAPDYHPVTIEFNLHELLDATDPVTLQPFDTVRIFGRYDVDAPKVTVSGEVLRPGEYPLSKGMTAADLLRAAGGFNRSAYREQAELGSYEVEAGQKVLLERQTIAMSEALAGDASADVALKPGDELMVRKLSGWTEIGSAVTLNGEVVHPGKYAIQAGERLSSVIRRAGGFRPEAYPAAAVLQRLEVKARAEESRAEMIRQLELGGAQPKVGPGANGQETAAALAAMQQQQQQMLARLRSQPVSGRLVIRINSEVQQWANTPADVEVRAGDVLTVPKRPDFILVAGQVYNAAALNYLPGKSGSWYLARAGGPTRMADRKSIFIVRANGSVESGSSGGWFTGDALHSKLYPGDTIVVPEKVVGGSIAWKSIMTAAQLAASVAITAGVVLQ